jgi:hypothetical protein
LVVVWEVDVIEDEDGGCEVEDGGEGEVDIAIEIEVGEYFLCLLELVEVVGFFLFIAEVIDLIDSL